MLFYFYPFIVDFFAMTLIAAIFIFMPQVGITPQEIGIISLVSGIIYFCNSYMISKIINKNNCKSFMYGALLFLSVYVWCFTIWSHNWIVYMVLLTIMFMAMSFFYVSYQYTMSLNLSGVTLYRFSCYFTVAWTSGIGIGGTVGAILLDFIPSLIIPFVSLGSVGTFLIVYFKTPVMPEIKDNGEKIPQHDARFVKIGWSSIFLGHALLTVVRGFYPTYALGLGAKESEIGFVLFWMMVGQVGFALFLLNGIRYLYSLTLLGPASILALGGFSLLLTSNFILHGIGVILIGVCVSYGTILSVFYSMVDPKVSHKNVPINESIVGIGFSIGPMFGGMLMNEFGFPALMMYLAGLVILVALFQYSIGLKKKIVV